jgi:hypothetical protein
MMMFHTRDSQLHDFAADDAYRSYLISRNQPDIVYHSGDIQWKRLCVAIKLTRNHIKGFFAAIHMALVADKMRRARRELARVRVHVADVPADPDRRSAP